jgi:hypothetical protein
MYLRYKIIAAYIVIFLLALSGSTYAFEGAGPSTSKYSTQAVMHAIEKGECIKGWEVIYSGLNERNYEAMRDYAYLSTFTNFQHDAQPIDYLARLRIVSLLKIYALIEVKKHNLQNKNTIAIEDYITFTPQNIQDEVKTEFTELSLLEECLKIAKTQDAFYFCQTDALKNQIIPEYKSLIKEITQNITPLSKFTCGVSYGDRKQPVLIYK